MPLYMHIHSMYMHVIMSKPLQSSKTLHSDARAALENCVGWNLRLAARRVTQFFEAEMSGTGVSFAQFGLMAEIASAPDDNLSALAQRMGLDQSTLSRTLRTLEGEGLVEIAIVEDDQRKRMVWLTEKGARRLEAALVAWRKAHSELARKLPADLVRRLTLETEAL